MRPDFDIEASRAVAPAFYRAPSPEGMVPREFQLAGVEYHLARRNALFGDAPGLGKTVEAILLGNAIRAKHTLVVCPASLRLNWEREIWKWSTIDNVSTYPILRSKDGVALDRNYVIVSYALLRNPSILHAIMDRRWDHLILDEAHAIKDPKGNTITQPICAPDLLPSVVGRITMASGTILPNQPIECYNAMRLMDWESLDRMSLADFREHYYDLGGGMIRGPVFDPKVQAFVRKLHWSENVRNVPRNLEDLQYRLRKHVMVRRLKEQVETQLPPIQWHPFPLQMTTELRQVMKHPGWKAAEKLYAMDADAFDHGIPVDGAISTMRKLLGEAKMQGVVGYAKDLIEAGARKLIVGVWHTSVLEFMVEQLKQYGVVWMDGRTSSAKKQAAVDRFQNDEKVGVIVGQVGVIGEGWTLTAAQDVIVAEPDWVPGKNEQLIERINRIGQKGAYTIGHVPVVPGSLDERIMSTAIRKGQAIHEALDKR